MAKQKTSPTQRTLKLCKAAGWTCQVTERWNPFAKVRQDLFGFIDIVALTTEGIVAIQTTTSANMAARIAKIKELPESDVWRKAGGRILVHGWKRDKLGKWVCREEWVE